MERLVVSGQGQPDNGRRLEKAKERIAPFGRLNCKKLDARKSEMPRD